MKKGGTLSWDETLTDSTVLPSEFADSSSAFKARFTNAQTTVYHITITVPDSTKPYFRIDRKITTPSVRDTSMPSGRQIWEVVTYGANGYEYDHNGDLVNSFSLSKDSADLDGLPLMAGDTLTANDSVRSVFDSLLRSAGQTVTTSGSEIIAEATIPDSASFSAYSYFDGTHLTQDSVRILNSGTPYMTSYIGYSTVGSYRVATSFTEFNFESLPHGRQDTLSWAANGIDLSFLYNSTHVKITTISNIQIP